MRNIYKLIILISVQLLVLNSCTVYSPTNNFRIEASTNKTLPNKLNKLNLKAIELVDKANKILDNFFDDSEFIQVPQKLDEVKNNIDLADGYFDDYISSENTYDLVTASRVVSWQYKALNDIAYGYMNGFISDLDPATVSNDPDYPLYGMSKVIDVIQYLENNIKANELKLKSESIKLEQTLTNNIDESLANQISITGEYAENSFESMIESGLLDPKTFELDLVKLNNGNTFSTQSFGHKHFNIKELSTYDVLLDTYVSSKKEINGYVNTAVDYYSKTETYKQYAPSVIAKVKDTYNKLSPEQKEAFSLPIKAHAALNDLIKTYDADTISLAIAKSEYTGWSNLTKEEQTARLSKSKDVIRDVVNLDNLIIGGSVALKTVSGLEALDKSIKATGAIGALNLAKIQKNIAELAALESKATNLPSGFTTFKTNIAAKQRGSIGFGKKGDLFSNEIKKNSKNSLCKQSLLDTQRNNLLKSAENPELRNTIEQMYRPKKSGDYVGNGSTADILREEFKNGVVDPKHLRKANERITQLEDMINRSTGVTKPSQSPKKTILNSKDVETAKFLLNDLQNAKKGL